jgi:uncharacterized protein
MVSEVHFQSGGLRCAADLYLPDGLKPGERRPAIVVGHGFTVVKEALVEQGKAFANAGFVTLTIDYRNFGRSEGEPRGQLFPLNEAEDYRSAISFLEDRSDVDPERIGIWGTSFAGGVVLYVAAVDRRVKATVSQVPVVDGYGWMKLMRSEDQFDELCRRVDADRRRRWKGEPGERIPVGGLSGTLCGLPSEQEVVDFFAFAKTALKTWCDTMTLESIEKILEWSPISYVDRISPRPLMILTTAEHDVVHPLWFVLDAYQRAREPKELALLPFGQLGLYADPGMAAAHAKAAAFFEKHLGETLEQRQARAAREAAR